MKKESVAERVGLPGYRSEVSQLLERLYRLNRARKSSLPSSIFNALLTLLPLAVPAVGVIYAHQRYSPDPVEFSGCSYTWASYDMPGVPLRMSFYFSNKFLPLDKYYSLVAHEKNGTLISVQPFNGMTAVENPFQTYRLIEDKKLAFDVVEGEVNARQFIHDQESIQKVASLEVNVKDCQPT